VGPILFGSLLFLLTAVVFVALWRTVGRADPMEARLRQYGAGGIIVPGEELPEATVTTAKGLPVWGRLVNGFGVGPWLARALSEADVQMTSAEYALIVAGVAAIGFVVAAISWGLTAGLAIGVVAGGVPLIYLRQLGVRRAKAFSDQLPEVLTLLVGALRAGQGLTQALRTIAEQVQSPARDEFGRVLRSVELGISVEQALNNMAGHFDLTDVDMLVTAINVQYQAGGNLAQTLEIIGETIRDRIRLKRQLRTLTAQQRITGYVLTVLPLGVAALMGLSNPDYMALLFAPGWVRLLPMAAAVMMVVGFLIIRRILDIEV
jgi:tight adherence protein B